MRTVYVYVCVYMCECVQLYVYMCAQLCVCSLNVSRCECCASEFVHIGDAINVCRGIFVFVAHVCKGESAWVR